MHATDRASYPVVAADPLMWVRSRMATCSLFADQLGPHFTDDHVDGGGRLLLVESRRVFARRRFHRARPTWVPARSAA